MQFSTVQFSALFAAPRGIWDSPPPGCGLAVTQASSLEGSLIHCSIVQFNLVHYNMVQFNIVHWSIVQFYILQWCVLQYGTVKAKGVELTT